jgi:hypothetical protein
VGVIARLSALFARREAKSGSNAEVEVVLDEDELFDVPLQSGRRLKIGGVSTQAFAPSEELLETMRDDDDEAVTRRVNLDEVRARLAKSG